MLELANFQRFLHQQQTNIFRFTFNVQKIDFAKEILPGTISKNTLKIKTEHKEIDKTEKSFIFWQIKRDRY